MIEEHREVTTRNSELVDVSSVDSVSAELLQRVRRTPSFEHGLLTLENLYRAYSCSLDHGCDTWEFAVEISDFLDVGVSRQELRHMVSLGWIAHKREITLPNLEQREFQNEAVHTFSDRSCFIITEKGKQQFREYLNSPDYDQLNAESQISQIQPRLAVSEKPVWDGNLRELWLGETLVKRFKWPATIQFAVLDRFQELGWPSRIENPLPVKSSICPKRRLHDAIKCLNQRKENDLIRFRGDGTGHGVIVQVCSNRNSITHFRSSA